VELLKTEKENKTARLLLSDLRYLVLQVAKTNKQTNKKQFAVVKTPTEVRIWDF